MDSYHSIVWPMVGNRWKPLQCIAIPLISMVARLKNHLNSIGTKLFMQWQWWRKKHNIFTIFCWRRLGLKTNWSCYDLFELAPRAKGLQGLSTRCHICGQQCLLMRWWRGHWQRPPRRWDNGWDCATNFRHHAAQKDTGTEETNRWTV